MSDIRLINANALKEQIDDCNYFHSSFQKMTVAEFLTIVFDYIDNAPTVAVNCKDCDGYEAGYSAGLKDAERPQGEWIKIFENPFTNGYICPFCGHKIQVTEQFLPKVTECENCGADMRGDNND